MSLIVACDFKECNVAKVVGSPGVEERDGFARESDGWVSLSDRGQGMGTSFHFCPYHAAFLRRDQWPMESKLIASIVREVRKQ